VTGRLSGLQSAAEVSERSVQHNRFVVENAERRDNQHAFSMPFSPESRPFTARLERPSQRESPTFSGKIGRGERI
jgi:hypothetical protein